MRRIFENVVFVLVEPPGAVVDRIVPTTYIDVSQYERFAFLRMVGTTDDTAVSMQVVQATTAAGANSKNVPGAALTPTVLAGTNDNKWAGVEVETRRLDINNNFRFVAVNVAATGGENTNGAILFIGWRTTIYPVTQNAAELVYVDG